MLHLKNQIPKIYRLEKDIVIIIQQLFVAQKSRAKTGRKVAVSREKKFTCLINVMNIMHELYSCLFYDKTVKFRLKHDILSNE